MKNLLLLLALALPAGSAFAGEVEVNKLLDTDPAVVKALEEIKASAWGRPQLSDPEITVVASSRNGGNPLGGNGVEATYLVRYPYGLNMDWNTYRDSLFVLVTEWNYTQLKLNGRTYPARKGIEVRKIYKSTGDLAPSQPELFN